MKNDSDDVERIPVIQLAQTPLGVIPKYIHEMKRMQELSEAINRYTHYHDGTQNELILEWIYELKNMLEDGKGK